MPKTWRVVGVSPWAYAAERPSNIKLSRELFASRLELVVRRRPKLPYSVCTTHVSALCHYRFVAFFAYITEPLFISGVFRREYDTNSLFNFFTANIANHKHLLSGGLVDRPHDAVMRRVNPSNICLTCETYWLSQVEAVVRTAFHHALQQRSL